MTKLDLVRAKCALLPVMFLTIAHVQRSRTQGPCCLHTWEIGELRSPDKVIGNKGRTDVDRRRRACVRRTPTRIGLCTRAAVRRRFLLVNRERGFCVYKVAHLKEGEVGQRRGSFVCARKGCVGGAEGPSARFGAVASRLFLWGSRPRN